MKKKKGKRLYYRTAALLSTQPQVYTRERYGHHAQSALNIPWKLIGLLILVGGSLMWLLLDDRWYLMGEDIRIVGAGSTTTAREVAIASDLLGWHGLRLRPRTAETLIVEKVITVTEAHVACQRFPASCTVQVQERIPSLNWVTEAGTYWVDAEGILIPTQEVRAGLPVVRGPLPDMENTQALVPVLQGVQALAALGVATEALEYHPQRGLIWTDPQGRRVAFGVGSEMQARWQIYTALVAHLDARNVFPWTIDVRFPESPTYSLERLW
ncbi:MAG TPA: cell division protein FtsQ/DivIB [Anaerolineae bacterium]|nr:cell division protein FtsQ/DivIB [Anaerolineae bacterium]HQH38641.1 cell division protein FtsQ/DivIB [Anaerolineae bacterium]